jgi:hypothetical protein
MSIEVTPAVGRASGKAITGIGRYDDGTFTGEPQDIRVYIASTAVVRGECVILVGPTATANVTVARMPVVGTLSGRKVIGVALNDAAVGQAVRVAADHGWVRGQATVDQGVLQSANIGVAVGAAIASTANTQFGIAVVATTASMFPSVTVPATNTETNGIYVRFGGAS